MHSQRAFTFFEMLITLTIVAILAVITVSGISAFAQHNKTRIVLKEVRRMLEYARDQAEVLRKPVSFSGQGGWQAAQVTFVDPVRRGEVTSRTQLLVINHIRLYGGSLHVQSFPASRNFISFVPYQDDRSDNAAIWYCAKNSNNPVWAVKVNQQSVIRSVFPNRRGRIRDQQGRILHC